MPYSDKEWAVAKENYQEAVDELKEFQDLYARAMDLLYDAYLHITSPLLWQKEEVNEIREFLEQGNMLDH